MARGNNLDKNTILTLNKDPGSIDLHKLALAKMKNVKIDSTASHDFITDRARTKNIKNIDDLYKKLNELERNGVLDIWIKKFGKTKYLRESIEIIDNILEESSTLKVFLNKKAIVEEMAAAAAAPVSGGISGGASGPSTPATNTTASGSGPFSTYGGEPKKNKKITQVNKYPKPTLQG
jgi:hypothetical protein